MLAFGVVMVACGQEQTPPSSAESSETTASSVNTAGSVDSSTGDSSASDNSSTVDSSSTDVSTGSTDNGADSSTIDSSTVDSSTVDTEIGDSSSSVDSSVPEDVEDKDVPTAESVLGDKLNVFEQADTTGVGGTVSAYTHYDGKYDVSTLTAGKALTITKGGIYEITGTHPNGQIYIKTAKEEVTIVLNGVNLTYQHSGPVIYAEDCSLVRIVLAKNSVNYLADSSQNGENGAIRVRSGDLILDGRGELTIVANSENGIANTKNLTINGGKYTITAPKHGIYGKLSVAVNGGIFDITSQKSGIKSGDNDAEKPVEGSITLNGGSFNIKCNTNGVNSFGTVEINNCRINIDSKDKCIDATKNVRINGGIITLNSKGDSIKSDADVYIAGTTNIKIVTNGNGIECYKAYISTYGVVYIKTVPVFTPDANGEYKLVGGVYMPIEDSDVGNLFLDRYTLKECKGIEANGADGKTDSYIEILGNVWLGIDSYEDCINGDSVKLMGGNVILNTAKDGVDAEKSIVVEGTVKVNIIGSDRGFKSGNFENGNAVTVGTVTLSGGTTSIMADSEAIKASNVIVYSGEHVLYDEIEATVITVMSGSLISLSTTKAPAAINSSIPNVYGSVVNCELCTEGKTITITIGQKEIEIVLPKDYTKKMSVLVAIALNDAQGEGTLVIGDGEATEVLTQGVFN